MPPAAPPRRLPLPKLGCGYAVCVLLAIIGIALLFAAERKWRQGQEIDAGITGGIGGLFCLAAVGLIAPMQRAVARARTRRQREEERPDEPWTWEPAWFEPTGIPQSGRRNGRVMMFAGLGSLIVSLPGVLANPRELDRGNFGALLVLLFTAVGIAFLSVAAVDALRRRKYGLARFVPERVPFAFGGELAGMVLVNRRVDPMGPGRVSLECHETKRTRHGNKRRQQEKVIANTEREIASADWMAAVSDSRLFVQLPIRGGVATSMTPLAVNHPTYEWRLHVQVPTAGPDFVAEFVVPVFDVAGPAEAPRPADR